MKYADSRTVRLAVGGALAVLAVAGGALLPAWQGSKQADAQQQTARPFKVRLPQLARDGLSPVGQNQFATSATAVYSGGKANITARVTAEQTDLVVVDIEVYGPPGTRVNQQYFNGASLNAKEERAFNVTWTPPAGAAPGTYVVKVGIFATGPEWETLFHWNDNAATFVVP
ncbi:MAG: hypothetical protein IT303_20050 [Dehalococcoidia bacterium]|nr:hypothetical protein [Dehalococcoidia bacterium]